MSRRLLLYVSSTGASLARWQDNAMREVHALPADVEGWEQLNSLILAQPGTPVYVVVDSVEELYRSEVLPRAWGRDRRDMTGRRLRQALHQTPYRAVLRQGPAGGDQVGDRYLFMGLTAPEILRPWLDVLKLRNTPLAGIWLAPILSQALLTRFGLSARQLLLVSEQTGGLRLSFFERGQLRFSRLAPVDSTQYDDPLDGYAEEIERTRQFLLSQRLLNRGDPLRTYLIDPLNTLEALRGILPGSAGYQCETVPRSRILNALRLPPGLLSESNDALFLALLTQPPASANLLPDELRRSYLHHRMRRWVYTGSAVWLGGTLALSLVLLADAWRQDGAADDARAQAGQARDRIRQTLAQADPSGRFEQTLATLQAWQHVRAASADPSAPLSRIRQVAQNHPGLRLTLIGWQAPPAGGTETVRVEGEIQSFKGDYQAAHQAIDAFLRGLRQSGWQAEVLGWPLDPAPDREMQGEFSRDQDRLLATFQLQLHRGTRP